jgi:hypothetical protein
MHPAIKHTPPYHTELSRRLDRLDGAAQELQGRLPSVERGLQHGAQPTAGSRLRISHPRLQGSAGRTHDALEGNMAVTSSAIGLRGFWHPPEFVVLLPHLRAVAARDGRAGNHCRIEVASSAPWAVVQSALTWVAPRAACGRLMNPFRARRRPSGRGHGMGNIYLASTCELAHNTGSARGRLAAAAYDAIEGIIAGYRSGRGAEQGGLL